MILFLLIAILGLLAQLILPWWSVALIAFVVCLWRGKTGGQAFLAGFIGIALVWQLYALSIHSQNDGVLTGRMSQVILKANSPIMLMELSVLIGGLVGGLALSVVTYVDGHFWLKLCDVTVSFRVIRYLCLYFLHKTDRFPVKNASLLINAVLAVAVAVLYYLHFKDQKTEAVSAPIVAEAKGKNIVYVNVDSLLTKYEFFKDAQKVLASKRFQLDNELNTKGRSLQNEVAFFQQKAPTMTQEQGRATEAALQKKQQDLVAYRAGRLRALAADEQKKNEELYNLIFDYLKKYNKQNKYEFVLGYTKGGGILFADSGNDVTQKVLAGINKEYEEKQTKK